MPPVKPADSTRNARTNERKVVSAEKSNAPPATPPSAAKRSDVDIASERSAATPTLDLNSLEQRLRETRAIGTFTKLSLKNQVDDLLDDFRAYYAGKVKTPLADLRQRYDLLLMKVLSLLQDSDVSLASAISSSREAIWGILRDPKKFAQI